MGKEFKHIDDLFRAELGGTQTEAPSFVKANIDKALGFEKRRRGYFLLSLLSILTLGGAVALWIHFSEPNKPFSQAAATSYTQGQYPISKNGELALVLPNESPEQTSKITTTKTNQTLNNQLLASSSTGTNHAGSYNNNNNQPNQSQLTQKNSGTVQNDNSSLNTASWKSPKNDSNSASTNSIESDSKSDSIAELKDKLLQKNTTGEIEEDDQVKVNKNETEIELAEISDEKDNNSSQSNETSFEPEQLNNLSEEKDDISDQNEINNEQVANVLTDTINSIDLSDLPEAEEITETETENKDELQAPNELATTIDPELKSNYKPMMISLTSGLNWMKSSYLSTDQSEKTFYDNSTAEQLGNQTNLDFTYRLKNGLTFGTGLGLFTSEEKYDFSQSQGTLDSIASVEYIYGNAYDFTDTFYSYGDTLGIDSNTFYNSVDTTLIIVDSVYSYDLNESKNISQYVGYNRATYLTVPVHLGTQILWKKFQFDIMASARFNFLLRSSGGYVVDKTYFAFENSNTIYKRRYIDLMLGAKVHYNFWKNLYITGAVKYRPVVGTTYNDFISFDKSFDYMHFGLGLSMKF